MKMENCYPDPRELSLWPNTVVMALGRLAGGQLLKCLLPEDISYSLQEKNILQESQEPMYQAVMFSNDYEESLLMIYIISFQDCCSVHHPKA